MTKKKGNSLSVKAVDLIEETVSSPLIEAGVDRERRVIRGISLLSSNSKNGRRYTEEALIRAVPLFEGAKTFANHPKPAERGEVRDVRDLIGKCLNVRYEEGKLKGDLEVLQSHKDWVFPLAEQASELVGLSINAKGRVRLTDEGEVVEEIALVRSVDLVSEPAATISLFESLAREQDLRTKVDELTEALSKKQEEKRRLERELAVERALIGSRLKAQDITGVFREALISAPDLETVRGLIGDREALIFSRQKEVRGMGDEKELFPERKTSSDEQFIKAVKGR
jgi:hypothetical protein